MEPFDIRTRKMKRLKKKISIFVVLLLAAIILNIMLGATAVQAGTGEVLILGSTVTGGMSSAEAQAVIAAGKTPVVVDDATWSSMTASQFASYDGIVLGDPTCVEHSNPVPQANASVWGPVINGNVIIIGSDPVYHRASQSGAQKLIDQGIAFALNEPGKTGGYLDLSCSYHWSPPGTPVPELDGINGGGFTVVGANQLPGLNDVHIVATHPALAGLTDADLSNWSNSVHEGFQSWPIQFEVLAIAKDPSGSYTATDGTVGYPYILARGKSLQVISDISLSPETGVNPVGTSHTLTATVTKDSPAPGTPVSGKNVEFTVIAGPHAGTSGVGITDDNGVATFTYTGTSTGIDTIEATFVDDNGLTQRSNRVTKEWIASCARPALSLICPTGDKVYWAGYGDYTAGLLSVEYGIANGANDATNVQLVNIATTSGVSLATGIPVAMGNIAAGTSASATVKFNVPSGVVSFKSVVFVSAQDACGNTYNYPK